MNDVEKLYPSKYLKPADLAGSEVMVTIANVTVEEIGQPKERRALLSFVGYEKRLVMNKTTSTRSRRCTAPASPATPARISCCT
jgi:hypothetical protein